MNFNSINSGELISYTDYLTVKSVNSREGSIEVENSAGQPFTVRGKSLIEGMNSGSQFTETKKYQEQNQQTYNKSRKMSIESYADTGEAKTSGFFVDTK